MNTKKIEQIEFTNIPSFVFRDRSLSVLEVMVEYLKDNKNLKLTEIASILNRDERTIWTVYRRAKLKRKGLIKVKREINE